jgi:hypothetical protein
MVGATRFRPVAPTLTKAGITNLGVVNRLRDVSGTSVEFWDEGEHQRDHERFKKWQRRNRYGYVLNFPVSEPIKFHKAGCPHIRTSPRHTPVSRSTVSTVP